MTTRRPRTKSPGAVPLRNLSLNTSSKKPSVAFTRTVRPSRGPSYPRSRPSLKRAHSSSSVEKSPKRRAVNSGEACSRKTAKPEGKWDRKLLQDFGLITSLMSKSNPAPRTEIEDHPDLEDYPIRMCKTTSEPEWYQRILTALPESSPYFIGPKRKPETAEVNLSFRKHRYYTDGLKFYNMMMADFNY